MKKGKYLIEYDCYVAENGNITQNDKEIKPYLNGGYMTVKLKINGLKVMRVHRLVALAFIPNPDNKPCIDHIDGNPFNNHVDNLRWVTHSENNNNPITKQRQSKSASKPMTGKFGANNHLSKAVLMLKNGVVIKEYQSINLAERDGFNNSLIVRCCKGLRKKHKGYEWKYKR